MEEQKIAKIVVKPDLCIFSLLCMTSADQTFEEDPENGVARVKDPRGNDSDDDIEMAALTCPPTAIFLYDEDGAQIWPKEA